jgi:hypothetical protein
MLKSAFGANVFILAQASAAVDPGNRALDHPAARLDLKADLIGRARDNLDRDTKHVGGPFDHIYCYDEASATARFSGAEGGQVQPMLGCAGDFCHPFDFRTRTNQIASTGVEGRLARNHGCAPE